MKILLIDDHALFREGVCLLLRELSEDAYIIEASDSASAFEALSEHPDLDLMLLDLNIPNTDGFSILESVNKAYPTIPVAILSASAHQEDVDRVMATSAMGYIHKNTSSKVMLGAIRLMLAGGLYTPPADTLLARKVEQVKGQEVLLTARQIQVLALIVSGDSNKQIAVKLGIAEATTKMHVTSIFRALGVQNRTQAALAGQGLI